MSTEVGHSLMYTIPSESAMRITVNQYACYIHVYADEINLNLSSFCYRQLFYADEFYLVSVTGSCSIETNSHQSSSRFRIPCIHGFSFVRPLARHLHFHLKPILVNNSIRSSDRLKFDF